MNNTQSDFPQTLVTPTPEDGFNLAIKLARLAARATQPDKSKLMALRPEYAENADSLIAASHVVAIHFQTIAQANCHWKY